MRALALSVLVFIAACGNLPVLPRSLPDLPVPMQLLVRERSPQGTRDLVLVVQKEDASLRWSLLDPLGMPLARQLMRDGKWIDDGLLPPNGEARELFAGLLFALTPADRLAAYYPASDGRQDSARQRSLWRRDKLEWRVRYAGDDMRHIILENAAGATWQVDPLPGADR